MESRPSIFLCWVIISSQLNSNEIFKFSFLWEWLAGYLRNRILVLSQKYDVMYCSNNLYDCNFSETLLIQLQISNRPAVDPHHFLLETTRNVFTNKLNLICSTNHNNYHFHWAFMASNNKQLFAEWTNAVTFNFSLSLSLRRRSRSRLQDPQ